MPCTSTKLCYTGLSTSSIRPQGTGTNYPKLGRNKHHRRGGDLRRNGDGCLLIPLWTDNKLCTLIAAVCVCDRRNSDADGNEVQNETEYEKKEKHWLTGNT